MNSDLRLNYLIPVSFDIMFDECNIFLMIGINLKLESPILNIRLRNVVVNTHMDIYIGYIGTRITLNYPYIHLGFGSASVCTIFYGMSFFCHTMLTDNNVSCISGDSTRSDAIHSLRNVRNIICSHVNAYSGDINVLDICARRPYKALARGIKRYACEFAYMCSADYYGRIYNVNHNADTYLNRHVLDKAFVVYQGHHSEYDSTCVADLVFPSTSFVEVGGLFMNCQGRAQFAYKAVSAAGAA